MNDHPIIVSEMITTAEYSYLSSSKRLSMKASSISSHPTCTGISPARIFGKHLRLWFGPMAMKPDAMMPTHTPAHRSFTPHL